MTGLISQWQCLDVGERQARLRCLQGLARVLGGPAAAQLITVLRRCEADTAAFAAADAALEALPTILLRRILASFATTLPIGPIPPTSNRSQEAVSALPRRDEIQTGER